MTHISPLGFLPLILHYDHHFPSGAYCTAEASTNISFTKNIHLIPLPRRLRARTPRHTSLIPTSQSQPLLRTQLQLPLQLGTRVLPMNKIAEATSDTSFPTVQPTTGFAEIGYGRELAVDGTCCVPARVKRVAGFLRRVFILETCIDVANEIYHRLSQHIPPLNTQQKEGKHTVIVIITHDHLLNLPELAHLAPEVFVESVKVILQLTRVHLVLWVVGRVLIQVWEEDGLTVGGLDVFSRAAVSVAAGADLVVERTVYFVGFGAKYASEVVGHCGGCEVVVGRRRR